MEFTLFLASNFFQLAGMLLLLMKLGSAATRGRSAARTVLQGLNISPDTLMLLCLGSVARVYWSLSPPMVFEHEEYWIKVVAVVDLFVSVFIHLAVVGLVAVILHGNDACWALLSSSGSGATKPCMTGGDLVGVLKAFLTSDSRERPVWCQAGPIAVFSFLMSFVAVHLGMDLTGAHAHAFPLADTVLVWNMTVDMMAMVPQLCLLASEGVLVSLAESTSGKTARTTTHFCALLSVARLFRVVFWVALFLLWGEFEPLYLLPDALHTLLMADFLYQWIRTLRRENLMFARLPSKMM